MLSNFDHNFTNAPQVMGRRYDCQLADHLRHIQCGMRCVGGGKGFQSMELISSDAQAPDRSLLIVDDDKTFLTRLSRAMEARGYEVDAADSVSAGLASLARKPPAYAVIDLRLQDGVGLDVISELKRVRPEARGIILTGYGNIATAVTAVKLGAFDYLPKPADADEIDAALRAEKGTKADLPENPMSADRVRWEHIQRVFELCGRNVSETARRLSMHRRTLQRILAKRAPR
jgi:two-component system, response regulator RegA